MGETQSGAVLENLQLNGFIAGGVAMASVLRVTCVVGKSMLMPVRVLEAIGGFAGVRNLLAEDQVIGVRVRKAGYSIRLSHHVIENVNRRRGFSWFLNRHSRWYKIRRQMALARLPGRADGQPGDGRPGLGLLGRVGHRLGRPARAWSAWAWRATPSRRAGCAGRSPKLRHLLFSPVKDLFLLPLWFDALVNTRVQWRGPPVPRRPAHPAPPGPGPPRTSAAGSAGCGSSGAARTATGNAGRPARARLRLLVATTAAKFARLRKKPS